MREVDLRCFECSVLRVDFVHWWPESIRLFTNRYKNQLWNEVPSPSEKRLWRGETLRSRRSIFTTAFPLQERGSPDHLQRLLSKCRAYLDVTLEYLMNTNIKAFLAAFYLILVGSAALAGEITPFRGASLDNPLDMNWPFASKCWNKPTLPGNKTSKDEVREYLRRLHAEGVNAVRKLLWVGPRRR